MLSYIFVSVVILYNFGEATPVDETLPPYVKQCHEGDPKLLNCLIKTVHHLRPYLAEGIKDIELPSMEPFRMDELSLSLTSGPNGYRIVLSEIDIRDASNFTVSKIKLSENGHPFEARIHIPKLQIDARYQSAGVLIILPASGNGTFHAQFSDTTALIKGKTNFVYKNGVKHLNVTTLQLDLDIKHVRMAVNNIFRNNRILMEAINLFLRENGHEVVNLMLPQLQKQLAQEFKRISNHLLSRIPLEMFYKSGLSS